MAPTGFPGYLTPSASATGQHCMSAKQASARQTGLNFSFRNAYRPLHPHNHCNHPTTFAR